MARFCDLGIKTDIIVGKSIDIAELFNRRILIEGVRITPTKFPGKNGSGMCMQMQVCLASFDDNGDYITDESGVPIGERRSCFTGSDVLISSLKEAKKKIADMNKEVVDSGGEEIDLYPLDTTIIKSGKCFKFT